MNDLPSHTTNMAASGGGVVPVPPKRPTIIRHTVNTDIEEPSVPVRPAPSRPAAPRRPNGNDAGPTRPQPPVPGRPSDTVKPKSVATPDPATNTKDKAASGSVRKRPEITIVCARPMSEVTFRDQKASVLSSETKPEENNEKTESYPSRPVSQAPLPSPRTAPRTQGNETSSMLIEDISDNGETDRIHKTTSVPLRGPPPSVPRTTIIKPDKPTLVPGRGAPPIPGRPSLTPRSQDIPDTSPAQTTRPLPGVPPPVPRPAKVDSTQPSHPNNLPSADDSPPLPRGPPPPIPSNPSVRTRPPPPKVPPQSSKAEKELSEKATSDSTGIMEDSNSNAVKSEDKVDVGELYAVINKPKRPTIIRPGRPVMKGDSPKDSGLDNKVDKNEVPKLGASPILPKRNYEEVNSQSVIVGGKSSLEVNDNSKAGAVPDFLKLKLKPTVVENNESDNDKVRNAAGSGSVKSEQKNEKGPPPLVTKPKPSVLPKPKIAAKPGLAAKPSAPPVVSKTSPEDEMKINVKNKVPEIQDLNSINCEKNEDVKPVSAKRPTIIRPSRPAQLSSSENIGQTVVTDTDKMYNENKQTFDDNSFGMQSRQQPPLPSKRPVSMVNIPQAFNQEETDSQNIPTSKSLNFTNSSENLRNPSEPKPSPRPAARARPASMAVGPGSRPPLPSMTPKLESSNQNLPPRPQRGPSQKSSPATVTRRDNQSDSDQSDTGAGGVSQAKGDVDSKPPPKPGRIPPPPKVSPHKDASSSDDEDQFVTAQSKPDRPAGRPPPPRSSPGDDVEKKPPRPGPPPPRKTSLQDTQDKENEPAAVRPPKPNTRPSRPVSTPMKAEQPSRSQPLRPEAPNIRKKKDIPKLPCRPGPGHPLYHYMMKTAHGIAVFDYTAQHADEISFKLGDVIILVRSVDTDWFVGKVDDTEGMFPRGFVKVKIPLPGETADEDSSSNDSAEEMFYDASVEKPDHLGHGPRCRARFDFDGDGPDDLVFEEGDVIRLLERVGLEWRKGECGGRTGLFPLTYIEMIEDLPLDGATDSSNTDVKALFDFEGGEDGELVFQAEEMIHIEYQVNEEWLYGSIGGKSGRFPIQFVDHVPPDLPSLPSDTGTKATGITGPQSVHQESEALSMWDTPKPAKKPSTTSAVPIKMREVPYCIAVYDYPGAAADDLTFNEGDRIELVERISADWLKGKLAGNTGMFPAAFVEVKVDITDADDHFSSSITPNVSSESADIFGIALHEFSGEADNELTFVAGDRIALQEHVEGAGDWRWGVIHGSRGIFPAAFVQEE